MSHVPSASRTTKSDAEITQAVIDAPRKMPRADLPRIYTKTDPRVFAFLDECCNKTCHPVNWYKHAKKRGMQFGECTGEPRTFKGLGDAKTLGKRPCYMGIEGYSELEELSSDDCSPDVLMDTMVNSHELSEGDNLMLLSLAAQATMGLVKDVESGTCYMKGEEVWMQLYTVAGSSLRAIILFDPEWQRKSLTVVESDNESIEHSSSEEESVTPSRTSQRPHVSEKRDDPSRNSAPGDDGRSVPVDPPVSPTAREAEPMFEADIDYTDESSEDITGDEHHEK